MTIRLPVFKNGKYDFCLEKQCELQQQLVDGDPAHLECWLCIFCFYSAAPNVNDLHTTKEIEQLRKTDGISNRYYT